MKKIISLVAIYISMFVTSCFCPDKGSTTHVTIVSARAIFYSFDRNGVFPYYESYNRNELGISVLSDSVVKNVLLASAHYTGKDIIACEDPHKIIYENSIDSINVFTLYNFNEAYPASSNVNDLLVPMYVNNEVLPNFDINEIAFISQHFKFKVAPDYDTMQFLITGRIAGEGIFGVLSQMAVIK